MTEANARSVLGGIGLAVQATEQDVIDPAQDGIVLSQQPGPGSLANKGDTVTIVVGRFRQPDVTGPGAVG
jgi:beta-lactam-binding protein with PASTA domain